MSTTRENKEKRGYEENGILRLLSEWAFRDLTVDSPMVFLSGPRQIGKTFLARRLSDAYFNWDTPEVKRARTEDPFFFRSENRVIVFDEIHKHRDWKKILKGLYDSPSRQENFVVTGSGRFDQYQKGGDSLQGRYFSYSLFPLTPQEAWGVSKKVRLNVPRSWATWVPEAIQNSDSHLLEFGGYPQPYLRASKQWLRKWQDQYLDRLIREDVRDFSAVRRLDQMDLLARLLPGRVGSPLSLQSLGEDIDASPVGVRGWLRLFETLYLGFSLPPFHRKIHRAVKVEKKWYFYQWTFVDNEGPRFENYLAVQLSAALSAWREQGFGRWELFYLRDQDRREVDFLICKDLVPQALVETKHSPHSWPASLHYYTQKLGVPGFLVYPSGPMKREDRGWSLSSAAFLSGLIVS